MPERAELRRKLEHAIRADDEAHGIVADVYERFRPTRNGSIARSDAWWDILLGPIENWRGGGEISVGFEKGGFDEQVVGASGESCNPLAIGGGIGSVGDVDHALSVLPVHHLGRRDGGHPDQLAHGLGLALRLPPGPLRVAFRSALDSEWARLDAAGCDVVLPTDAVVAKEFVAGAASGDRAAGQTGRPSGRSRTERYCAHLGSRLGRRFLPGLASAESRRALSRAGTLCRAKVPRQ